MKDDGGAVDLTENQAALRHWLVSGPEMGKVVEEFEASTEKRKCLDFRHHEEAKHLRRRRRRPSKKWEIHSPRTATIFLF